MSNTAKSNGKGDHMDALDRLVAEQAPAPLPELLDRVLAHLCRYVSFANDAQPVAVTLWIAHVWAFAAAHATPILRIYSAEKGSGKTRLFEVIAQLVREPMQAASISPAALYRAIEKGNPTLLQDEVDALWGTNDSEKAEDLRGLFDSGYREGGSVYRCVGADHDIARFNTFSPKATAGIDNGRFPPTIADRSLPIFMKKRRNDEPVDRFLSRAVAPVAQELRTELETWAGQAEQSLRGRDVHGLERLPDRPYEIAEPLQAIAELASPEWAERSREALLELLGRREDERSVAVQLLDDIRSIFKEQKVDRIGSADLVKALCDDLTGPYGAWGQGRTNPGLTQRDLASMLRPHGIRTIGVRIGVANVRGYLAESFQDAFQRHLPGPHPQGPQHPQQAQHATEAQHAKPLYERDVADVADVAVPQDAAGDRNIERNKRPNPFLRDNSEFPKRRPSKGASKHGQPPRLKRKPNTKASQP